MTIIARKTIVVFLAALAAIGGVAGFAGPVASSSHSARNCSLEDERAITAPMTVVATTTVARAATGTTTTTPPAIFAPDAKPLTIDFGAIGNGRYRLDTLGTPFAFTTDRGSLRVQANGRGFFVLSDPFSEGTGDRDVAFVRLSAPVDPETRRVLPADYLTNRADDLPAGVTVSDRRLRFSVGSTSFASISK